MPGTQKLLKDLFMALKGAGTKPLYRYEKFPQQLMEQGFDEARQLKPYGGNGHALWGETTGIHYAPDRGNVSRLVSGKKYGPKSDPNVIALPLSKERHKTFTPGEWQKNMGKSVDQLNSELKPDYDFVTYPDLTANQPDVMQTVQLNPNKVVAKIGTADKHTYKILGAGGVGAMGLLAGDMLSPNDSEAANLGLGKQIKGVFKLFKSGMRSKTPLGDEMRRAGQKGPAESSAHTALKGLKFKDGVVSGVYQGVGDSRYIHLEDGRIFPTNKDTLHDLCCAKGATKYVDKFEKAEGDAVPGGGAKWDQILKSLHMNETRGTPPRAGGSKPKRIEILEDSLNLRNDLLSPEEVTDQIFVRSNRTKMWFMWPRAYAEPAEAAGLVTIDRTKKTLSTNKELYNGSTKKVK